MEHLSKTKSQDVKSFVKDLSESEKRKLIERLNSGKTRRISKEKTRLEIPRVGRDEPLPLSIAQRNFWYTNQLSPGTTEYIMPIMLSLRGPLNVDTLSKSLNLLLERHESLRTLIRYDEGRLIQDIKKDIQVEMGLVDLISYPPREREKTAMKIFQEESLKPFSLADKPLLRASLARTGNDEYLLLLNIHHIACDGFSLNIINDDLWTIYSALTQGKKPALKELPIQYADYILWRLHKSDDEKREQAKIYWKKQLAELQAPRLFPDHARPATPSAKAGVIHLFFPSLKIQKLRSLAEKENATIFMGLLAAFNFLLYRQTGQTDTAVTSIINGRDLPEIQDLVGFFASPFIIRTSLGGHPNFLEILRRTAQAAREAFAHRDFAYECVMEEIRSGNILQAPSVYFQFLKISTKPRKLENELNITPILYGEGMSRQDIEFHFIEDENALKCLLVYNQEIYERSTMDRMAADFSRILELITNEPERPISQIPLISPGEERRQIFDWNFAHTEKPFQKNQLSIPELFSQTTRRSPEKTAIICEGVRLSYEKLNNDSDLLAQYLMSKGIRRESVVGVYMERSPEYIIALLGILKSGGAYLPLDPADPEARFNFICQDSAVALILTNDTQLDHFQQTGLATEIPTIGILEALNDIRNTGNFSGVPSLQHHPDGLAYIMYTSGSAGKPRPVAISHRNVLRLVKDTDYAPLHSNNIFLQLAPLAFDASTFEIWASLLNGATLVVYPGKLPSATELSALLDKHKINTLWLTANLFHQLAETNPETLRRIPLLLTGGEVVSAWHLRRVLEIEQNEESPQTILNCYGPTENTTFSSTFALRHINEVPDVVPIGTPITKTRVYVLNENLQPTPPGVPGELYLGGEGLARGYQGRPDFTAERFIPDPFDPTPGRRMYRTCDLALWTQKGELIFLGRTDNQIKLDGHRIEPGEIEFLLKNHPDVSNAFVMGGVTGNNGILTSQNPAQNRQTLLNPEYSVVTPAQLNQTSIRLRAYIVLNTDFLKSVREISAEELRYRFNTFLKKRLPSYMLPSQYDILDEIPLTKNGKVDLQTLMLRETNLQTPKVEHVPPENSTEAKLIELWEELLNKKSIGVLDDFFDLGGTSLMAARMTTEVRKRFRKDISLSMFLQGPNIRFLAQVMHKGVVSIDNGPLVALHPNGSKPPLFLVHPMGGTALCYLGLSRNLGVDQPVYAFQSPGLYMSRQYWSVEEMAAMYVDALQSVQPRGPYYLGGWSFGGYVAMEMCRILEKRGQEVALLALLDCAPPLENVTPIKSSLVILATLGALFFGLVRLGFSDYEEIWNLAQGAGLNLPDPGEISRLEVGEIVEYVNEFALDFPRIISVAAANFFSGLNYAPTPFAFRKAVLFRTGHEAKSPSDPYAKEWRRLLGGLVEVQAIPGDHMDLLNRGNVESLAGALQSWLLRARHSL